MELRIAGLPLEFTFIGINELEISAYIMLVLQVLKIDNPFTQSIKQLFGFSSMRFSGDAIHLATRLYVW